MFHRIYGLCMQCLHGKLAIDLIEAEKINKILIFILSAAIMNVPPPQRPWIPLAIPNRTRPACKFYQLKPVHSALRDHNNKPFMVSIHFPKQFYLP